MSCVYHSRLARGVLGGYKTFLTAIAVVLLLTGTPAAIAQSVYASLSGTVTDGSGAVVAGAKIHVTGEATKVVRHTVANGSGFFSMTQLPTGTYTVTVEEKGFEKWEGTGIVLNSNDDKTMTIPLKIGAESTTVEVSAESNDIAITDTGARIDRIDSNELEKLSTVGRNATEILKILPGASMNSLGGTNRPTFTGGVVGINGGIGDAVGGLSGVTLNGLSGTSVSITSDGQNTQDPGSPGNATPINPNPDMISEVSVQTSNFSADNTKGPIVVSTISKAGSASFHGDARFHARNSAMDAEEANSKYNEAQNSAAYAPGQLKIPYHYYYPGGGFGGPVIIPGTRFNKNKTKYQFHESYEYYDQLVAGSSFDRDFVPTADMLNGDFSALAGFQFPNNFGRNVLKTVPTAGSNAAYAVRAAQGCTITGGKLSSACISPMAQQLLKLAVPTASIATPNNFGFNYVHGVQSSDSSYQNMLHGDVNFSDNTKLYVNWSHQSEHVEQPNGLWISPGDWEVPVPGGESSPNKTDLYTANFLHIFSPSLTVEARFGFTNLHMNGAPKNPGQVLRASLKFPQKGMFGAPMAPRISNGWDGGGIPNLGDWFTYYHPQFLVEKHIPSTGADVTKVFKTHTAKAGFFWEQSGNAQDANGMQYGGVYNYPSWAGTTTGNQYADILMGLGFANYTEANFPKTYWLNAQIASFYATDHWKLNRRITVDYGMRFEHYGAAIPQSPYGAATFTPSKFQAGVAGSGISWNSLDSSVPKGGVNPDLFHYAPRFGAAIDVFGNGKTVVRGGWGVFLSQIGILSSAGNQGSGTPSNAISWNCGGSSDCLTWEQIDGHINNGSGGCATTNGDGSSNPNQNCAPALKPGQVTETKLSDLKNTSVSVADSTNKTNPGTTTYSLNIDQQLPGKILAELAYVGNHTDHVQNSVNMNAIPVGTLNNSSNIAIKADGGLASAVPQLTQCLGMDSGSYSATNSLAVWTAQAGDANCQQKYRPYPVYQSLNAIESTAKTQYDAFQFSLKRSAGWAVINLNYSFAKNLGTNNTGSAFKDYGVHEYWGVQGSNRAHVVNAAYVFDLPKMTHGNPIVRKAANGWEFSGISTIQSGQQTPGVVSGAQGGAVLVGSPDVNVYPQYTCNPAKGLHSQQYLNGACYSLPTPAQGIGSGRTPYLPGPMYWNSDATFVKNTKLSERQNLELRFAAFNFLNHALPSFNGSGDGNLTAYFNNGVISNATDSQDKCPGPNCKAFGYVDYHFGHRVLELGAKYTF